MGNRRSAWTLGAAFLLTLMLITGSAVLWKRAFVTHPGLSANSVTAAGTELLLDGNPWWPTGFNAYQLATDWSLNAGCGAEVDLDAYFGALPARTLTRFSLFASFTQRKDDGTIDYSSADAVFAAAQRHGQLVLPVLAPGDGACDGERFKELDWYESGWRERRASAHGTFAQWVRSAVARWKDSPALAGWTAVGEPETSVCRGGDCRDWQARSCPAHGTQVLRRFYDEVGALIRSLDPEHLLFAGFVGAGQCGTAGEGFTTLGASTGIDVLEYHDYTLEEPAAGTESAPARIGQASALGKPLLVAELGLKAGSCRSLAARAEQLRSAISRHRTDGAAGALAWSFVPEPRPGECTFDIGPGDPLWPNLI